jgi:hypothetical protein
LALDEDGEVGHFGFFHNMDPTHPSTADLSPKSMKNRRKRRKGNVTETPGKKSAKVQDSSSDMEVTSNSPVAKTSKVTEEQTSKSPSNRAVKEQTGIVPAITRYLVIKDKDAKDDIGGLKGLSPFIINKQIMYHAGQVKNIKKLRNGTMLVETANDKQTSNLLKMTCIGPIQVLVEPHRQLNVSQGVISCWDLVDVPVEEIKAELADQHVIEVRRIMSRKTGQLQPTQSLILTFSLPSLPASVKAAFYNLPVRPYIPSPLRCFKCQHYGHTSTSCKATSAVCAKCGTSSHGEDACLLKVQCVNCKGDHTAWSRDCPVFKEEKRVRELMVLEKLSFTDARRRVKAADRTLPSGAFATVAARQHVKTVSVGTQTVDVSVQTDLKPPARSSQSPRSPRVRTSDVKQQTPVASSRAPRGVPTFSPRKISRVARSPLAGSIKRLASAISANLVQSQSVGLKPSSHSLTADMVEDPLMDSDWHLVGQGGKPVRLKRH